MDDDSAIGVSNAYLPPLPASPASVADHLASIACQRTDLDLDHPFTFIASASVAAGTCTRPSAAAPFAAAARLLRPSSLFKSNN